MDKEISKKQQMRTRAVAIAKIAVPVVLGLGALLWFVNSVSTKTVRESDIKFSTTGRGDIDVTVNASGRVAPAFEEVINSPIASRIVAVRHRPGDVVEAGTPLLVLDLDAARVATDKQADQLRMKRLELRQQESNDNTALSKLQMEIKVGDMKVRRLEAELRNERYLDSIGSGTTDKVREAEFALQSERLQQEQLRQQYANERDVRRAAADVKRLEIEISEKEAAMAARTLDDAEIRAPRRATVTSIFSKIGSVVNQGQELAVLADLGHYKIDAEAADAYGSKIVPGYRATVRIGATSLEGMVGNVAPVSANGLVSFTVTLDNDSCEQLRPGLRPDVYVSQGLKSEMLRITNGSYYSRPGNYSLFVRTDEGTLERRDVQLGAANMDYVEVVSGLREGEQVVISDMSDFNKQNIISIK